MGPYIAFALLCAVAAILIALPIGVAQGDGFGGDDMQQQQQQQQQVTLTREAIERLLQTLSPSCRQEMESALAVRGDVSDSCKIEIQEALRYFTAADLTPIPGEAGPMEGQEMGGEFDGEEDPFAGQARRRTPTAPASNGWISPVAAILAFVVVLFGSAAAYVLYFNSTQAGAGAAAKPKKLSKKKEEKQRQKSSRGGQMIN